MSKKNVITTAALAALATAASVSAAHAQSAPTHSTSWTGTVGEDRYDDARFKMRGRFQYDFLSSDFEAAGEEGTRTQVRRAFLGVQGRLTENWRYKVDFVLDPGAAEASGDEAVGGADDVGVDDAFLEYAGDAFSFVIGEFNITSPLEDRTSSLDIPFNERSALINGFGYGRAAGAGIIFSGANYSFAGAVQGDSLNSAQGSFSENESFTVSARGTWAPLFETTPEGVTLVHLGAHVRQRDLQGDDSINIRPANGRGATLLDSGIDAENDLTYGVELAGQYGPFGATAEYSIMDLDQSDIDPADGGDASFEAYYVDLFWSLTGESRAYDPTTGSFKATRPANSLANGGWGHWGLAARYESIDLSGRTDSLSDGEASNYIVGLSWVPIEHVQFRLNYAHSDTDREDGDDRDANIVSLRTQFDF